MGQLVAGAESIAFALRPKRKAPPIMPKPTSIISQVPGSGTAATAADEVALTKLLVNGPVVLMR